MSGNQVILAGLLSMWVALVALTLLVCRALGWPRLKPYLGTLSVLALALCSLPAGAVIKIGLPYRARLLSYFVRRQSPAIVFPAACSMFPANNIWNTPVADLPVDPKSRQYIDSMGARLPLHGDFGPRGGIPYAVAANQGETPVSFYDTPGESDPGPYRMPANTPIELGADAHALAVDPGNCVLYELFSARRPGGRWEASSAAIFDLRSNHLRPKGWTSADAAGLPILPGLVRFDEVQEGRIPHALRFTTPRTRADFVWPARHRASRFTDANLPPMGQRFRLRRSFDMAGFSWEARVILTALKQYGMMLADNGSPWFITGAVDSRWNSKVTAELRKVAGGDFEAVDVSGLMVDPDSGEARRAGR